MKVPPVWRAHSQQKSRSHAADVHVSSGTGGKTCADRSRGGHASRFCSSSLNRGCGSKRGIRLSVKFPHFSRSNVLTPARKTSASKCCSGRLWGNRLSKQVSRRARLPVAVTTYHDPATSWPGHPVNSLRTTNCEPYVFQENPACIGQSRRRWIPGRSGPRRADGTPMF